MTNTTTPSKFMDRLGIEGHVTTTNGPRLHIQRVRHRFAVKDRADVQQRVFIDLNTYQAHCFTFAEDFTPGECLRESRDVQRCLASVARLARIYGIAEKDAVQPVITQARLVSIALLEAGVRTVLIGTKALEFDARALGRLCGVKDTEPFVVSLRPTEDNRKWWRPFDRADQVGNPVGGLEVHVAFDGSQHAGIGSMLKWQAEAVLAEVFGNQWNTPSR